MSDDPERRLLGLWGEIHDLGAASAVLGWDQETQMPPRGQEGRGRALATLAGIRHDRLTAPELREALDACAEVAEPDSELAAQVREARRQVDRATAVPAELTRELAATRSRALASWQRARAADDFSVFRDDLSAIVALTKQAADAMVDAGIASRRYDALIDGFEPGATEEQLAPLLGSLRDELSPLVHQVADSGVVIDESPAKGTFPGDLQLELGRQVVEAMGYDTDAGRIDESAHPFTTGFNHGDVRITWRWEPDDFRPGLFGLMHETGHALYEQGLPERWEGTPIGEVVSLGVHESQSRLWENLVGRSRAFWVWALPRFAEVFPERATRSVDELWPVLHTMVPSLIRVEADEGTYNLHIVARFEIERALIADEVSVDDLPGLWADTYDELLGVRPPSDADGVLQDIHWSMGAFGYFPTYTLGNLMAAQLFEAARAELGDLDEAVARGELDVLLGWLHEHVHGHAARYSADELIERATGRPLSADAFLAHLRGITAEAYGVAG